MTDVCDMEMKTNETYDDKEKEINENQDLLNHFSKTYVVYRERWLILLIFAFYSASNALHSVQYSVIQDAVVKFYGVTSLTVYWTAMISMITYIPLVVPASWIIDKMGLRVATILGAFGNLAASWLKVLSVSQDLYWLGLLAQIMAGLAQAFVLSLPPKVAVVWFGADQVSTACSIGVFGYQFGIAIGFVMPPLIVHTESSIEQLADEFKLLFYIVAGASTGLFIAILLFLKSAPATPPSVAADLGLKADDHVLRSIKKVLCNRNYVLLILVYSITDGVYYAIAVVLNELILPHFPGMNKDVGYIGLVHILAGMVGSIFFGIILDKTHRFKETSVLVNLSGTAAMLLFTFTLSCGHIAVVYLSSALLGFFLIGYLAVGFELAAELTYPEPEEITSGILNASLQFAAIALIHLYEYMLRVYNTRQANLVFCALLALATVISSCIRSDLRRQAVQKS